MNTKLRLFTLRLHRWSGLAIGWLVVLLAVTGAAMVFRPQLEPVLSARLMAAHSCAQPLALGRVVEQAQSMRPGTKPQLVKLAEGESTTVRFNDMMDVYVDPCTGEVRGEQHRWSGFFNIMEQLHRFRFMSDTDLANLIVGSAAFVIVLVFVGGGLMLWWPNSMQAFRRSLRLQPGLKGRAFTANLHRVVGAYAALVLLVISLCSLPIAFKSIRYGLYSLLDSPRPTRPVAPAPQEGAKRLALQQYLDTGRSLVPGATRIELQIPRKPDQAVELQLLGPDAPHANAYGLAYLDAFTGRVLAFEPYAQASAGSKAYRWMKSIHMGYVGGLPGQVLLFLAMLAVPVLGWTGVAGYLRRRRQRAPAPARGLMRVRVAGKHAETAEISTFELVPTGTEPLPPAAPGAHIDVHVGGVVRQYSLCNGPDDRGYYLIAVKREPDSRGGSRAMHEDVAVGQVLQVGVPRNLFPLAPDAGHYVLVAAGIGITPIQAMARHLLARGASFELHYFVRSEAQAAFVTMLGLEPLRGKVRLHAGLERPALQDALAALVASRRKDARLYVCGPQPFMALVGELADQAGWPADAVHTEHFGADPKAQDGPRTAFTVQLSRSGRSYDVPADKSILAVLSENGVKVPTSCEQGFCGSCVCGVLEGTPDHRDSFLSDDERRAGRRLLPCVSRARTARLVLEL